MMLFTCMRKGLNETKYTKNPYSRRVGASKKQEGKKQSGTLSFNTRLPLPLFNHLSLKAEPYFFSFA